jgi:hypothetical protein
MRPEIENLKARMSGMPLTKYQMALSKTEYVKLLDYVAELEQLRIHDVIGRSEQFICYKADLGNSRCSSQCVECGKNECYSK